MKLFRALTQILTISVPVLAQQAGTTSIGFRDAYASRARYRMRMNLLRRGKYQRKFSRELPGKRRGSGSGFIGFANLLKTVDQTTEKLRLFKTMKKVTNSYEV